MLDLGKKVDSSCQYQNLEIFMNFISIFAVFRIDMSSESCPDISSCAEWQTKDTYIKINGVTVTTLSDMGFYIVTIPHATGEWEKIRLFNTHAKLEHSTRMADFLNNQQSGTIILGISYGDSGAALTDVGLKALVSSRA